MSTENSTVRGEAQKFHFDKTYPPQEFLAIARALGVTYTDNEVITALVAQWEEWLGDRTEGMVGFKGSDDGTIFPYMTTIFKYQT